MQAPVTIELAGEPVAKQRPRFMRKTGHAYTPSKTIKYEDQMRYAATQVMGGRALLTGGLRMVVVSYQSVPASYSKAVRAAALEGNYWPDKKPDIDNVAKIAMDGLSGIVFHDDKQVVDLWVRKLYSERPRLWIEITSMGAV
jgi:Holliday junction resolvase RusA-like endonuclease